MKASQNDFTQAEIKCITEVMEGKREPSEHPAYPTFGERYKGFCDADDARIEAIWSELIKGYQIQLQNTEKAMKKKTNKEYLDTVNDNEHFRQAATMIQEDGGLAVPPDEELALWSGGYSLSVAIRDMRYCPLEGTSFGNLLDNLKVTWEWKREGGLWNILSAAFVEGYETGRRAHIYFRTVDEMSVLYEQELPMLMQDAERVIVLHPVYQQGTQTLEVGYDFQKKSAVAIQLAPENRVFACRAQDMENDMENAEFLPYKALTEMLGRQGYAANKKVYLSYRSDKFIPGHAPFAREDEQTAGQESRSEERQKFWKK